MGKLMFDDVRLESQILIQQGARNRSEAVAGHGLLVVAHIPQCGIDGVFTHRPVMGAQAGEYIHAAPSQSVKLL